jgi:hypothetical protein
MQSNVELNTKQDRQNSVTHSFLECSYYKHKCSVPHPHGTLHSIFVNDCLVSHHCLIVLGFPNLLLGRLLCRPFCTHPDSPSPLYWDWQTFFEGTCPNFLYTSNKFFCMLMEMLQSKIRSWSLPQLLLNIGLLLLLMCIIINT